MAQFFYEHVTARRRVRLTLSIERSRRLHRENSNHSRIVYRRNEARVSSRLRMTMAIAGLLTVSWGTYLYAAAPYSGAIRIALPPTVQMAGGDARLTVSSSPSAPVSLPRVTVVTASARFARASTVDRLDAVEAAIRKAIGTNVAQQWAVGGFTGYAVAGAPDLQDNTGCRRVAVWVEAEGIPGRVAASDWCLTRRARWTRVELDALAGDFERGTASIASERFETGETGTEVDVSNPGRSARAEPAPTGE